MGRFGYGSVITGIGYNKNTNFDLFYVFDDLFLIANKILLSSQKETKLNKSSKQTKLN